MYIVSGAFGVVWDMFDKQKAQLMSLENMGALRRQSTDNILKWAFKVDEVDWMSANMDQLRIIWSFKHPGIPLSKGKKGLFSEGEVRFMIREYIRLKLNDQKTHIEYAIDNSIKMAYNNRKLMTLWKNTGSLMKESSA